MIHVICDKCGKELCVKDSKGGSKSKCPECKSTVNIPCTKSQKRLNDLSGIEIEKYKNDSVSITALGFVSFLAVGVLVVINIFNDTFHSIFGLYSYVIALIFLAVGVILFIRPAWGRIFALLFCYCALAFECYTVLWMHAVNLSYIESFYAKIFVVMVRDFKYFSIIVTIGIGILAIIGIITILVLHRSKLLFGSDRITHKVLVKACSAGDQQYNYK